MNTIEVKRPYEDVRGTDRDGWLLSLDERALPHREALMATAEHLLRRDLGWEPCTEG